MDSEVRASSCKFRPAGVGDLVAKIEEERLEVRASSCDFCHAASVILLLPLRLSDWRSGILVTLLSRRRLILLHD